MRRLKTLMIVCIITFATSYFSDSQGIQINKIAYNPNAGDYTGMGYPDVPVYVAPLDAAPGLVLTDTDFDGVDDTLLPNFQVSDEDFSGTCVPGDVITFYIEVYNGTGDTLPVEVRDDIPIGTYYNPATCLPPSAPGVIVDTTGDAIIGNGGDTIVWDIPDLPSGYTLLTYEVEVLADGTVNFGGSIVNNNAAVHYNEQGIPRVAVVPPVIIEVQTARIVKEAFADLACTIPAPAIQPGSRLYYRLTLYNTIDPASPNLYTAQVTGIFDTIPANTTNPQYHVSPPGLAPQPIVGSTVSWQGINLMGPGAVIYGIYSVLVPLESAGRITNNAQLTYDVAFPPAAVTTVTTTSNTAETQIGTASFSSIVSLFDTNVFFVAGDNAYCTDVLGSAKIAFGLASGGTSENPEGRTDILLTATEHDSGNLIIIGGPAVNPVADEFDGYFGITYQYVENNFFQIFADGYSIYLNLNNYPQRDICIVYLAEHNGRNATLVWGYGWQGTYAGSILIGDPQTWQTYSDCHMLMLRWMDANSDGLVQVTEIIVEKSN
jgi:hypothetical protein